MAERLIIGNGEIFNRLTVVCEIEKINERRQFKCKCECGVNINVILKDLRSGHTKSCGCFKIDEFKNRVTTHGKSKTKLYKIWKGMRRRCENSNAQFFQHYGGRGISVCKEWSTYEPFYEWSMNNGYKQGLSIDRIENNGNYSPDNCRWTTHLIQARNARSNNLLTFNGKTQCLSEWAEELGIKRSTLSNRINTSGWSIEKALTEP